ncbi:hypothetical protein NVP1067O_43 [Vibrio phage 1.067.O._10N.261.52.C9]|nr:hypothetical protein NVP1067O_43 [Vibrio phage 1.067.O._10N.261.52.C9]AUR86945.1 hypothetical protein NVP1091O_42 [Vibrio phage 1.091.O._10N.286.52.B12]
MKNADMPAMPQTITEDSSGHSLIGSHMEREWQGLTKREMFAMHAMANFIGGVMSNSDPRVVTTPEQIAGLSVKYADVLLEELSR